MKSNGFRASVLAMIASLREKEGGQGGKVVLKGTFNRERSWFSGCTKNTALGGHEIREELQAGTAT